MRYRLLKISLLVALFLLFKPLPAFAQTTYYFSGVFEKVKETGVITKYYPLPGNTTAVRQDNQLSFLHADHLSSTRLVTSQQGTVDSQFDYYPYGNLYLSTSELSTSRLYTSQILDSSTDLYFYNARQYNPTTASFISADTAQGPNRYAYVAGNPISRNDPSGNAYREDTGGGGGGVVIFGQHWQTSAGQHRLVDPNSDEVLANYLTEAQDKILTPQVEAMYLKNTNLAQKTVVSNTAKYVYQTMPTKDPSDKIYVTTNTYKLPNLISFFTPILDIALYGDKLNEELTLGSTINEGGVCWEHSILAEVLLNKIDPDIVSYVQTGRVDANYNFVDWIKSFYKSDRHIDIIDLISAFNFAKSGGGPHAWLRVTISGKQYMADPQWRGAVLPWSEESKFHRGSNLDYPLIGYQK